MRRAGRSAYWTKKAHLLDPDEFICSVCGYSSDEPYVNCPDCGSEIKEIRYDPVYIDEAEMPDMILDEDE